MQSSVKPGESVTLCRGPEGTELGTLCRGPEGTELGSASSSPKEAIMDAASRQPLLARLAAEGSGVRRVDDDGGEGSVRWEASIRAGKQDAVVGIHLNPKKLSSAPKTLGNMLVSIIGAGVLGLPYAFRRSGWLFSLTALAVMALVSWYGMLLLVKTRKLLEKEHLRRLSGASSEEAEQVQGRDDGDGGQTRSTTQVDGSTKGGKGEERGSASASTSASSSASEASTILTKCSSQEEHSEEAAFPPLGVRPDLDVEEEDQEITAAAGSAQGQEKAGAAALLLSESEGQGLQDGRPDYVLRVTSYGDLGYKVMGIGGQLVVDAMVCVTQCGFCAAYLIFVGENVSSVILGTTHLKRQVIVVTAVLQVFLSWMRSLSKLAFFSIFADVVNMCAFSVIVYYGVCNFHAFPTLAPFTSLSRAPAALGVAVYSFEGVGTTLPLEASMKEPRHFPTVLSVGVALIATAYGLVGFMGYLAFGDDTHQIVTLNLPHGWASATVKLGLSLALCFTFPVMMHPVYAVYETRLCRHAYVRAHIMPSTFLRRLMFRTLRAIVICLVAYTAVGVPHFSTFIALVGSSTCSLLGFVLPAFFHLRVGMGSLSALERGVDYALIVFGVAFSIWGTLDSVHNLFSHAPRG